MSWQPELANAGKRARGLACGVKLFHGALPHHLALMQEDDAVHCRTRVQTQGETSLLGRESNREKSTALELEKGAAPGSA